MFKGHNKINVSRETKKKKTSFIDITIGKNIKYIRQKLMIDRKTLGAIIGVSYQQVFKYENAINRISASSLFKLAQDLEINIEIFFIQTKRHEMYTHEVSTVNEYHKSQLLEAMIAQNILRILYVMKNINKNQILNFGDMLTPAKVETREDIDNSVFLRLFGLEIPYSIVSTYRVKHSANKFNELLKRI